MGQANSTDSYGAVIFEILFVTKDAPARPLPAHEFLQSFTIQLNSDRAWQATLNLFDRSAGKLTSFIGTLGDRDSARFKIRWGWENDWKSDADWIVAQVLGYNINVVPRIGTTLSITLAPDGVPSALLKRNSRAYKEGTPIADIVNKVVKDNNWQFATNGFQNTKSLLIDSAVQAGESDIAFLNDSVAWMAEDNDGNGGYRFFIDKDGKAHFHNTLHNAVQVSYNYRIGDDANCEVVSFNMTDNTAFSAVMGGGNAEYRSIDSDGGTQGEQQATQTEGLGGKTQIAVADALYNDDLGDDQTAWVYLPQRKAEAAKAQAELQHQLMTQQQYTATMVVRGTHAIDPLDYIGVDFLNSDGSKNFLSGTMQVLEMSHVVSREGWITNMLVIKGGTDPTPEGIKKIVDKQLNPAAGGTSTSTASDSLKPVQDGGAETRRQITLIPQSQVVFGPNP